MIYTAGALGFVVALLLSVVLHEGGHFLTARRYGMKATQFFVGFGPTLFSRRRGETEYGVKAIPAGGFVKIVGMTPLEKIDPADEPRAFYKQPTRRKVVVLAAGSTMHFIVAVVLVLAGTFLIGVQTLAAPGIAQALPCVARTVEPAPMAPTAPGSSCRPDHPGSPALAAGLADGDRVVAVAGEPVTGARALIERVRANPDRPLALTVERDGVRREVTVTPVAVDRPSLADRSVTERVGAIGIQVREHVVTERVGFTESLRASADIGEAFLVGIKRTVTEKLGSVTKLYSPDRDPEGLIGVVGVGRISGEVLASEETAGVKALSFVLLVASLNLFVGAFNLLPLLPLDGGHIAVALYESARDKVRRLRGYRGPFQHVDYNRLMPLTYGVAGSLLVLTLLILGADIVNPVRLG